MKSILSLDAVRGALAGLVGTGIGVGITILIRLALHIPVWNDADIVIGIFVGVLAYLIFTGVLNYWFRWAIGSDPPEEKPPARGWRRYFNVDTNHKVIGVQYFVLSMALLPFAVGLQLAGRLDMTHLFPVFLNASQYESVISDHGIVMLFMVVLPAFSGFMNYFVPLQIGARDMAFPRLNAFSFWLAPAAGLLAVFALAAGGFDTGWTVYPPLSAAFEHTGMDLILIGVYISGLSSILNAVNILTTIHKMRAPGMSLFRMPIFIWAVLATVGLALTWTQLIGMSFIMVLLQRTLGFGFFNPAMGGQALLYQYLFWGYSHPAVYIFVLIGLGIITDVIPVFVRKPLFGYVGVALASPAIAIGGMMVFGHHMFASGMPAVLRIPFMVTTLLVAIPTGVKVFAWVATMWLGKIRFTTAFLFVITSIIIFLTGGLMGIPLGIVPTDLYLHDTYFVVGHFHAMLFGGFLLPTMGGIYYWFPKVTGRMLSEKLGKWQWAVMAVGTPAIFISMLGLGIEGMRRRVATYPAGLGYQPLQIALAVGGFLVFAGLIILAINVVRSLRSGEIAGDNPWDSKTLEWMVSSPPPENNFPEIPQVLGRPYLYGLPGVHARMGSEKESQYEQ